MNEENLMNQNPTPCEACGYFDNKDPKKSDTGICHRYPGTLRVHKTHWCGEHKPLVLTAEVKIEDGKTSVAWKGEEAPVVKAKKAKR